MSLDTFINDAKQSGQLYSSGANSEVYGLQRQGIDFVLKLAKNPSNAQNWEKECDCEKAILENLNTQDVNINLPKTIKYKDENNIAYVQIKVPGLELTEAKFNSLDDNSQQAVARQLASFMYAMHHSNISDENLSFNFEGQDTNQESSNIDTFFNIPYEELIDILNKNTSAEDIQKITEIMNKFDKVDKTSVPIAALHNDLRTQNVLYDDNTNKAGVIDFGGSAKGSVYRDFASLGLPGSLGPQCMEMVIGEYNLICENNNENYRVDCDVAKTYSVAKLVGYASIMDRKPEVAKMLKMNPDDNGKWSGMSSYLEKMNIKTTPEKEKINPYIISQHMQNIK